MDSEVFLTIVFGSIIVAIGIGVWLFVRHFANEPAPEGDSRATGLARAAGRLDPSARRGLSEEGPELARIARLGTRGLGGDVHQALEHLNVPSYLIDATGVIRWVNPAARQFVGDVRVASSPRSSRPSTPGVRGSCSLAS